MFTFLLTDVAINYSLYNKQLLPVNLSNLHSDLFNFHCILRNGHDTHQFLPHQTRNNYNQRP